MCLLSFQEHFGLLEINECDTVQPYLSSNFINTQIAALYAKNEL